MKIRILPIITIDQKEIKKKLGRYHEIDYGVNDPRTLFSKNLCKAFSTVNTHTANPRARKI